MRCLVFSIVVALATHAMADTPGRNHGGGGYRGGMARGGYADAMGCGPVVVAVPVQPPGGALARAQRAAALRATRPTPTPGNRWQLPRVVDFGTQANDATRSKR